MSDEPEFKITIRDEFQVHKLNADGMGRAMDIAKIFSVFLNNLESVTGVDGREMDIVRTKLQEANFFAKCAVAVRTENQEPGA